MTALTALAMVAAGVALTGAPDWRARVLGVLLVGAGMVLAARRWDARKEAHRVDNDRGMAADRVGAGIGSGAAGGDR